jgi:hypothetical protein
MADRDIGYLSPNPGLRNACNFLTFRKYAAYPLRMTVTFPRTPGIRTCIVVGFFMALLVGKFV